MKLRLYTCVCILVFYFSADFAMLLKNGKRFFISFVIREVAAVIIEIITDCIEKLFKYMERFWEGSYD